MSIEEIIAPRPEMTDYGKAVFATEVAFGSLVTEATKLGLPLNPVAGLMYLPDEAVTQQFQQACRAVLKCLAVTPA